MKLFTRAVLIIITCLSLWFIIHTAAVVIDGLNDELQPVDAAVVLGNKVELNGQPSERLKARLDKAIELYDQGYFSFIIVSGGVGKEGFDEAAVMKSYLVEAGIPEERIAEDNDGYDSGMTAENSSRLMEELEMDSVMVITQYFHISRTKLAFRKAGVEEVYGAHANYFEARDIYSIVREFPAYYKYLIN